MTREEIDNLEIGDRIVFPNDIIASLRKPTSITDIFARGTDRSGNRFVCFYLYLDKSASISHSTNESLNLQDTEYCQFYGSLVKKLQYYRDSFDARIPQPERTAEARIILNKGAYR